MAHVAAQDVGKKRNVQRRSPGRCTEGPDILGKTWAAKGESRPQVQRRDIQLAISKIDEAKEGRKRSLDAAKKEQESAQKEAEDSAEFAKSSPYPEPETIFEDVYWEVDNKTEAGQTGRHFFND